MIGLYFFISGRLQRPQKWRPGHMLPLPPPRNATELFSEGQSPAEPCKVPQSSTNIVLDRSKDLSEDLEQGNQKILLEQSTAFHQIFERSRNNHLQDLDKYPKVLLILCTKVKKI